MAPYYAPERGHNGVFLYSLVQENPNKNQAQLIFGEKWLKLKNNNLKITVNQSNHCQRGMEKGGNMKSCKSKPFARVWLNNFY